MTVTIVRENGITKVYRINKVYKDNSECTFKKLVEMIASEEGVKEVNFRSMPNIEEEFLIELKIGTETETISKNDCTSKKKEWTTDFEDIHECDIYELKKELKYIKERAKNFVKKTKDLEFEYSMEI